MVDLVLASSSPRRAELLRQMNLSFRIVPPDVPEAPLGGETPEAFAARLSREKARQVAGSMPGSVVLGADTVVVLEGEILGKPRDRDDATDMLMKLSGRDHSVVTGVTLAANGVNRTKFAETIVSFRELNFRECDDYWKTGEPRDKAGAYGIQGLGAIFVTSIRGSYSNVVGLPILETALGLREFGIDCLNPAAKEKEF